MTFSQPDFRKLDELIEHSTTGTLTPRRHAQLEQILLADQAARQHYLARVFLLGRLRWLHDCDRLGALGVDPSAAPAKSPVPALGFLQAAIQLVPGGEFTVGLLVLAGVCAACLQLAIYMGRPARLEPEVRVAQAQLGNGPPVAVGRLPASTGPVARLIQTADCVWGTGRPEVSVENRQTMELLAGIAEFRFDSGVHVVVHGPCSVNFESTERLAIGRGKMAARVPRGAEGFTVATPLADIVDLGTEFAVEVGGAGATNLAVIKGAVEIVAHAAVDAGGVASKSPPLKVTAGHAITVSLSGGNEVSTRATTFDSDWVRTAAQWSISQRLPDNVVAYQASPVGAPAGNQTDYPGGLCLDFEVTRPIRVFSLGAFDHLGDGFAPDAKLTVQLWSRDNQGTPDDPRDDTGREVLAEQTFSGQEPGELMLGHRFKPTVRPIELVPGSYAIIGYGFSKNDPNVNIEVPLCRTTIYVETWRGAIVPVASRWGLNSVPGVFPKQFAATPASFLGGSFRYAPVEPDRDESTAVER